MNHIYFDDEEDFPDFKKSQSSEITKRESNKPINPETSEQFDEKEVR
jgi:hypothetical protein